MPKEKFREILIKLTSPFNKISEIDLSACEVEDEDLDKFLEALKVHFELTSLNLSDNKISDAGACRLATIINIYLPNLAKLYLGHNHIRNIGLRRLTDAMIAHTYLECLDFSENLIGTDGAYALAQLLRVSRRLKSLNLQGNCIGPKGAAELAIAIRAKTYAIEIKLGDILGSSKNKELTQALKYSRFFAPISTVQYIDSGQYEEWMAFLSTSNSIIAAWHNKDFAPQIDYMRKCQAAIIEAAKQLHSGNLKTIKDLYVFLAQKRKDIDPEYNPVYNTFRSQTLATYKGSEDEKAWKALFTRSEDPSTDADEVLQNRPESRYGDQYPLLYKLFVIENYQSIVEGCPNSYRSIINPVYNEVESHASFVERGNGYVMAIMRRGDIVVKAAQFIANDCVLSKIEYDTNSSLFQIYHPYSDVFDKIFNIIDVLFQESLRGFNLYINLGKIAWYLAQAMPTHRGNASITEMLFRTIFKYHEMISFPFRRGINFEPTLTWDWEAIFTADMQKYADKFQELFYQEDELKEFVTKFHHFQENESKVLSPKS